MHLSATVLFWSTHYMTHSSLLLWMVIKKMHCVQKAEYKLVDQLFVVFNLQKNMLGNLETDRPKKLPRWFTSFMSHHIKQLKYNIITHTDRLLLEDGPMFGTFANSTWTFYIIHIGQCIHSNVLWCSVCYTAMENVLLWKFEITTWFDIT